MLKIMSNYYLLTWKHTSTKASAFAPENVDAKGRLIPSLEGKKSLPFVFSLRKVTETKKGIVKSGYLSGLSTSWLDYQPNDLGLPVMSAGLRNVIDDSLTGSVGISWITCNIRGGNETKEYFVLRFSKKT
jgi:hypothetical protein